MNKGIAAGVGVGIGLLALAVIFLVPNDSGLSENESPMGVELSDQVELDTKESKSYEVDISEGLEVGDGTP